MIKRIYKDEIHFKLESKEVFESYIEIMTNRGAKVSTTKLDDRYILYSELEIDMENEQ